MPVSTDPSSLRGSLVRGAPGAGRLAEVRQGVAARLEWIWARVLLAHGAVRGLLARFDPNDDPDAEPLGILPLLVLLGATSFSTWMYLRWKFQPMQDLGHHAALSAVVADYGRPGSLYTALYEPFDPVTANSLLYEVAGRLGRLVGVTNALRACMAFYVGGMPLVALYALRVFGRSAWPAILAVPLVYNMIYVAGFANMLFAAPFMVLALVELYRLLDAPSWGRLTRAAALFTLVFLAHAHMFLWIGALSFLLTFAFVLLVPLRAPGGVAALRRAGILAGSAFLAVLPSLLFFLHWYRRTFGPGRAEGGITQVTGTASNLFGAYFATPAQLFASFADSFRLYPTGDEDLKELMALILLVGVAFSLGRLHRYRRPPVLELACVVTGISYFFLPVGLQGHDVLNARQLAIALWFLPAFVSPVPAAVSRAARGIVILSIVVLSGAMLRSWYHHLVPFEREEAQGLETVMRAAPPRMRLHYVKLEPDSAYFTWRSWWHIEKIYMSDKLGQTPDTPGILSTGAIHYRAGVDIHRLGNHSPYWQDESAIWKNFDLVLVHKWHPSPDQIRRAKEHGDRLAQAGDWELWQSREATPIAPSP